MRSPLTKLVLFVLSAMFVAPQTIFAATGPKPRAADCNLARKSYDNPFSDHSGWSMRRYEWHAFYAGLSTLTAYGIHKTTKLPTWASAAIATVGLGLVPHIRGGLIKHDYPVNALDWSFDVLNRAAPAFIVLGKSGNNWESKTIAATSFVGGYFALACYSSP